jgi:hypothetical protein
MRKAAKQAATSKQQLRRPEAQKLTTQLRKKHPSWSEEKVVSTAKSMLTNK